MNRFEGRPHKVFNYIFDCERIDGPGQMPRSEKKQKNSPIRRFPPLNFLTKVKTTFCKKVRAPAFLTLSLSRLFLYRRTVCFVFPIKASFFRRRRRAVFLSHVLGNLSNLNYGAVFFPQFERKKALSSVLKSRARERKRER